MARYYRWTLKRLLYVQRAVQYFSEWEEDFEGAEEVRYLIDEMVSIYSTRKAIQDKNRRLLAQALDDVGLSS